MLIKNTLYECFAWCKRQTYHFIFIFSLLSLTLLVTWWSVYLYRSVNETIDTKIEGARNSVYSYTLFMGHNAIEQPKPGEFFRDHRLEIVASDTEPGLHAREILPFWKGFWLMPKRSFMKEIEAKRKRRRFMVIGETTFLLFVILLSGVMIYRMYWLEKRTTQELHELWSRMSHEIKTPITGVKAFLETLQSQEFSKEEMAPLLDMALKQVERQQQLTENMLIGQKLKRRASGIKLTRLAIYPFLQAYLQKHPFRLSGGNLELVEPGQEESSLILRVDPEALRIIFDNLIDNARKYGGDNVSIKITFRVHCSGAIITVEDNGPGFHPDLAGNVFKAYKRLENELPGKQQKGTGMGLYISRRLARKMGGNLTAYSEGKGKGARFTLILRTHRCKGAWRRKHANADK